MRKSLLLLLAYILPFVGYATTSEPPVITLNPVASSICGGGSVSFTTASNDPAATYSWEYYDGSIWQFANNPALFSGIGTATLTVTNVIGKDGWYFRTQAINSGGESALTPYVQLTVDVVAPVASLTGANRVATGNTVVLNGTGSGRSPVWVSSNPGSATVGSDGSVTGVAVGYTTISYTISNACGTSTDTQRMEVFSTNITPSFTLSSPQSISLCQNATAMDVKSLLHVADADAAQTLTWTVSSPAAHGTVTATGATASTGTNNITPGGTITYQPTTGYGGSDAFTIRVSDGVSSSDMVVNVVVNDITVAVAPTNVTCNGASNGSATATATGGTAPYAYIWSNGHPTQSITGLPAGIYHVWVTDASGCEIEVVDTITEPALLTATLSGTATICNGTGTTLTITSAPGATVGYTVDGGSVQYIELNASGAGSINTGIITANKVYALVNASNGLCTNPVSGSATISTFAIPVADTVASQVLCAGANTDAVTFTGTADDYAWSNNNTTTGLETSGTGNIAAFTATNNTAAVTVSTVTVTPMIGTCSGSPVTFTISVKPIPTVASTPDGAACNGDIVSNVEFTGNIGTTVYNWTNTDASVGLAAGGAGSIPGFTAVNATNTTRITGIVVTPVNNGCTGASDTFNIAVYPTPDVTATADQVVCNAAPTTAVHFTGSVASTAFSWHNDNTSIGLGASNTTDIASFMGVNTGADPVMATITVLPTANGCTGTTDTFRYIITPTPTVSAVGNQLLCNTDTTTAINFSGTVPGTVYSWTNSNASIGLAATGTGDIAAFPAVNAGNVFDTATIVVLPSIGACEGATQTFNIVVKPTPTVDAVSNQVLCNGATTTDVTFTSAVAGTANNWVNTNTAIGLAAGGAGNILSFAATNTTVAPISGNVTVTPSANGCTGASRNFTYTVNPTPRFSTSQTGTVCSGAPYTYVPASATTGVSYAWTRAVAAGISNAAGSGSGSVGETLYNTTLAAKTATYHYTLTANGCSNQQNVVVTVDPTPQAPVITVTSPANVCSQTTNMNFGAATTQPDTVQYTWTANGATVLAQGVGHQNAIISFPTAGDVNVVLTANATGFSCTAKDTFQVNVGSAIANNAEIYYIHDHFFYTDNTVDNYQWGYDDAATLDSVIYTGQVDQNLYLSSPDFAGKKYWVMVSKGGCLSKIYYNAPTGVADVNSQVAVNLVVVPNPASDYVSVAVEGVAGDNDKVELTDLTGKTVITEAVANNKAQLGVSNLASGIYVVTYYHNGVKAGTAKLVKE